MAMKFLILSICVSFVYAATWQGYLPQKPKELAHKVGCYIEEINDVIPFGHQMTPIGKGCYRIECTQGMLYYASCGVIMPGDPEKCHKTTTDLTKSYPECCPNIVCDEVDDKINNNINDNSIDARGKGQDD